VVVILDDIDRKRRLSSTRNMAAIWLAVNVTAIGIGEYPVLMTVLGLNALVWLCYMVMLSGDIHEIGDKELQK
jgi:hypothetical protein